MTRALVRLLALGGSALFLASCISAPAANAKPTAPPHVVMPHDEVPALSEVKPEQPDPKKSVRVFGYLLREVNGDLVLEIPDDERGPRRALLRGKVAERELATLGPDHLGAVDLASVFGLGKRPAGSGRAIRASNVVVTIEGHAEARDDETTAAIHVTSVDYWFDSKTWSVNEARHVESLERARAAIERGAFKEAAEILEKATGVLAAVLGAERDRAEWYRFTIGVAKMLEAVASSSDEATELWSMLGSKYRSRGELPGRTAPTAADRALFLAAKRWSEPRLRIRGRTTP
jgi:hypothetical protein